MRKMTRDEGMEDQGNQPGETEGGPWLPARSAGEDVPVARPIAGGVARLELPPAARPRGTGRSDHWSQGSDGRRLGSGRS